MKDLSYLTYELLNAEKEDLRTTKKIEKFLMETYSAADIRVDKQLIMDTNLIVDIDILEDKYRWKCQSTTTITYGPQKKDIDRGIWRIVGSYTKNQIAGAKGFICIGSASAEGNYSEEEERAAERMRQLCNVIKKSAPGIPVYGFNLGKFIEDGKPIGCSDKRKDQRRIVILKITYQRDDITIIELSQAVKKILLIKANSTGIKFPIDIRDYSKYQKGNLILQQDC